MKKGFLLFLVLVMVTAAVYSEEKPVITVFDFQISEAVTESEMTSIISLLSSELFKTGEYTVLDIQQRDSLMDEMQFSMSGVSDEQSLLELGKLMSAESIVTGKIGTVGGKMVLNAKMLETETARVQSTADGVYGDIEELLGDIAHIAGTLAGVDNGVAALESGYKGGAGGMNTSKIIGFSCLGAGVVLAGTGGYLLADSLVKLSAASDAEAAYLSATSDYTTLYNDYLDAFNAAENSNTMLFIGAGLIGTGVASALLSLVFFNKGNQDKGDVALFFMPSPEGAVVQVGFSY